MDAIKEAIRKFNRNHHSVLKVLNPGDARKFFINFFLLLFKKGSPVLDFYGTSVKKYLRIGNCPWVVLIDIWGGSFTSLESIKFLWGESKRCIDRVFLMLASFKMREREKS